MGAAPLWVNKEIVILRLETTTITNSLYHKTWSSRPSKSIGILLRTSCITPVVLIKSRHAPATFWTDVKVYFVHVLTLLLCLLSEIQILLECSSHHNWIKTISSSQSDLKPSPHSFLCIQISCRLRYLKGFGPLTPPPPQLLPSVPCLTWCHFCGPWCLLCSVPRGDICCLTPCFSLLVQTHERSRRCAVSVLRVSPHGHVEGQRDYRTEPH